MTSLTAERLRALLSYDAATGSFVWRRREETSLHETRFNARFAGTIAGCLDGNGYRKIRIDGRLCKEHRLAWLYVYGRWPANQIDHINGVRDDNRIANLREATTAENGWNSGRRRNGTSDRKGVTWHKRDRKWRARIRVSSREIHLGSFACPEEASRAYAEAAAKYHGEFARID